MVESQRPFLFFETWILGERSRCASQTFVIAQMFGIEEGIFMFLNGGFESTKRRLGSHD